MSGLLDARWRTLDVRRSRGGRWTTPWGLQESRTSHQKHLQALPNHLGRAIEDTGLAGRTIEDAGLAVEAGFRAVAPRSAMISKNGFENRKNAYESIKVRFHDYKPA